jgi:HEAT repeat protein
LAAVVLGSLGRDLLEAVPPLVHALKDEDETVRRLAAEALEKFASVRERPQAA